MESVPVECHDVIVADIGKVDGDPVVAIAGLVVGEDVLRLAARDRDEVLLVLVYVEVALDELLRAPAAHGSHGPDV